jgi:hypothetical protein
LSRIPAAGCGLDMSISTDMRIRDGKTPDFIAPYMSDFVDQYPRDWNSIICVAHDLALIRAIWRLSHTQRTVVAETLIRTKTEPIVAAAMSTLRRIRRFPEASVTAKLVKKFGDKSTMCRLSFREDCIQIVDAGRKRLNAEREGYSNS